METFIYTHYGSDYVFEEIDDAQSGRKFCVTKTGKTVFYVITSNNGGVSLEDELVNTLLSFLEDRGY